MNNKDFAAKLNCAIEQQKFEQLVNQFQDQRPIDVSNALALMEPNLAWQLLERLPNRSTVFSYLEGYSGRDGT